MFSLACSLLIPIFSNYPCRGLLTEHAVLGIEETLSIFISFSYWDRIGEVTCGGSPHLSCKRDKIDMRDCLDRWVTSPTWGPPPPCKQALRSKEAKWQRLPRRWSCYIGSEKRGFWTRISTHFSREIPRPTSFINIPNIICHFRFSSMLKFWRTPLPRGSSQIPYPVNVFPNPALYFGQIPDPGNTLTDPSCLMCFCEVHD